MEEEGRWEAGVKLEKIGEGRGRRGRMEGGRGAKKGEERRKRGKRGEREGMMKYRVRGFSKYISHHKKKRGISRNEKSRGEMFPIQRPGWNILRPC